MSGVAMHARTKAREWTIPRAIRDEANPSMTPPFALTRSGLRSIGPFCRTRNRDYRISNSSMPPLRDFL